MSDYRIRLIKSLVAHLDQLAVALHEQADAIRENTKATQEATKQQAKHPSLSSPVSVELDKPVTIAIQGEPKTQEKKPWDWRDNVRFGAELIGLGVLIWYAVTTNGLWTESQRQTNIAETGNRPWLQIVAVTLDDSIADEPILRFTPAPTVKPMQMANLRTEFRIKNIGKGVAQGISIEPDIVFEPWTLRSAVDVIADAERASCEYSLRHKPLPDAFTWSAIFPGDEVRHRIVIGKPFPDSVINHIPDRDGSWLSGFVIGCVTYQYPRQYQTRAVFHIMGPKDRFVEVGKNLVMSDLHLLRDEHYEHAQ